MTTKTLVGRGTVRGTYSLGPDPAVEVHIALLEVMRLHGHHIKTLKVELMPPHDYCLDYVHEDADKPDKEP